MIINLNEIDTIIITINAPRKIKKELIKEFHKNYSGCPTPPANMVYRNVCGGIRRLEENKDIKLLPYLYEIRHFMAILGWKE